MFLYFKGFYNKISTIHGKYIFSEGENDVLLMPIILIFLYLKVFGFKVPKDMIIYLYIVIIFRTKLANTLL